MLLFGSCLLKFICSTKYVACGIERAWHLVVVYNDSWPGVSMLDLLFFTSNPKKAAWANTLAEVNHVAVTFIQKPLTFSESRDTDVARVATKKLKEAKLAGNGKPFIVEDSGFYIDALGGFPATHVNFVMQTIGIKGILKLLAGLPTGKRGYTDRSALAFYYLGAEKLFVGENRGRITRAPRGGDEKGWGNIMRILQPEGYAKTLAEFTPQEWAAYTLGPNRSDSFSKSIDKLLTFLKNRKQV